MKRIVAFALLAIMLLSGCGTPDDTTLNTDVTDVPITDAPQTDVPDTASPEPNPPETEPPAPRDDFAIAVKEDTYVLNKESVGDQSNVNFGDETEICVKTGSAYFRYGYVKFDISKLATDSDISAVDLDLKMKVKQHNATDLESAVIEIYASDCETWDEKTLTFSTQPQLYSLIAKRDDLNKTGETYSFPITDYVKQALACGRTEISLCIKEVTDTPLLVKFVSKEGGEDAPKLSVYHGTKTDNSKYDGNIGDAPAKPSEHGLDAIFGVHNVNLAKLVAVEDTHIVAGASSNKNFGSEALIEYKAQVGKDANEFYRIALLKFDIGSLEGVDFSEAYFELYVNFKENTAPTTLNVYCCDPYAWDEMSVTYNTRPEREDLIGTGIVTDRGTVRVDITEYLKECVKFKDKFISFYLEGSQDSVHRVKFYSKESGVYTPFITVLGDGAPMHTQIAYNEINPWEYAMENVSDWLNRWEVIKQGGDPDAEMVEFRDDEYTLLVDAAENQDTDGANTKYTPRPTRTVDTLKGYAAAVGESEKYDIYGGLMDESMRQEATGFFYTKKIGDRWWNIDPLGYPYFRFACVQITMGTTKQRAPLLEEYGSESTWAQAVTDWMWELGFNSAGGWSNTTALSAVDRPISQTGVLSVLASYCKTTGTNISTGGGTTLLYDVLPVFDPAFVDSARNTVKSSVKGYEGADYIYGWMSDNELPDSILMLDYTLKTDPNDPRFAYNYATAWTFLYMKTGKTNLSADDITDDMRKEYRAMVYDRYFNIVRDALERYAPNHQYMGCRLLTSCAKDEYVLRVAGYWCDVITYNYYRAWSAEPELICNQQKWAGKPIVITEWYAKGMDVWEKDNRMTNKSGAGFTVRNQYDRGQFYQNFALSLLEFKGCVGFDWFKYMDNDPDNLSADTSNRDSNKGIIDNDGNVYTDLTEQMEYLNNQKYSIIKFFDAR